MKHLILSCLAAISLLLAQAPAIAVDLSPALSDLSKDFSEKFCKSIANGMPPEKAGKTSAAQLSKGLLFSPVMKEIMSASKEDLAISLSDDIFDRCGNDIGASKEELDHYLAQ